MTKNSVRRGRTQRRGRSQRRGRTQRRGRSQRGGYRARVPFMDGARVVEPAKFGGAREIGWLRLQD
jgi:hypothetical protein